MDRDSELLEAIFDLTGNVIVALDREGRIVRFNQAAELVTGYTLTELLSQPIWEYLIPAEQRTAVRDVFNKLMHDSISDHFENEWVMKNGTRRLFEWNNIVVRDAKGKVTHVVALGNDITARKQTEVVLRNSEKQLRFVLDGSALGFWDWNIVTSEVDRNERWAVMLGYTHDEIKQTAQQWTDFIHADDRDRAWKSISDVLAGHSNIHKIEYRMLHKDGGVRWILDQANVMQRDADGKPTRMCGTHTDITERKQTETELENHRHHLETLVRERTAELARINAGLQQEMAERKRLENALIQADERQQRTLGRELHDGLGQQLTSIAFFGATLTQRLERQERPEAESAQRIVTLVSQAIEMVRALARGLYPAALESAGLRTALQELADNTRALNGVDCELCATPMVTGDDPSLAIHLYRIAQEAVNNALKHGQAKHIRIVLEAADGQYRLLVSDNGHGFDPARLAGSPGMGLHNMRYRAALLGGELLLASKPMAGTTLSAVCPILEKSA